MWEEILNIVLSHGIWAVLFVAILVHVLRDSHAREGKYQQIIEELSFNLGVVKKIDNSLRSVENKIDSLRKLVSQRPLERNVRADLSRCSEEQPRASIDPNSACRTVVEELPRRKAQGSIRMRAKTHMPHDLSANEQAF